MEGGVGHTNRRWNKARKHHDAISWQLGVPDAAIVYIVRPYLFVVMWWVMYFEFITHVLASRFLVYKKYVLFYLILHPIKPHINCLGTFFP